MEYKKIFAVICITSVSLISVIIGYSTLGKELENTVPVINTLSAEQLGGFGYTVESKAGDDDLWEDIVYETTADISESSEALTEKEISFPLDINTATAEELAQIKGIGTVTAQNIISYRDSYGYFYSLDDLLNVKGVGETRFENIKEYIFIDEKYSAEVSSEEFHSTEKPSIPRITEAFAVTEVPYDLEMKTEKSTVTADYPVDDNVDDYYEDDNELIEEYNDFYDTDETSVEFTETVSFTETEYSPVFPLELNSASAKDLTYINGISDTLAQRIVEYGCMYGFYEIEDLKKVSGIGESKFLKIAPYVYVDNSRLPPRETTAEYEPLPESTVSTSVQIYRININTADKYDFMQLPGIDEATADNLIKLREDINGFAKIEELILADNMTEDELAAIWDYVYI